MEPTLDILHMKNVLAKNIDVKDTLDYVLYGIQEPKLWVQFLLLGPIFSEFKTHRYFFGVTTSGILFVEVNNRYEEKWHKFYKYYELNNIEQNKVLKGIELKITLRNGENLFLVFPRVVLGLQSQEETANSSIRVIQEKIKSSKEYFRMQNRKNQKAKRGNQRENRRNSGKSQRKNQPKEKEVNRKRKSS